MRWVLLGALTLILVLGLANVFGQHSLESTVESSAGSLVVDAPRSKLRGGLYFMSRFTIVPEEIEEATLVLDPGWLEGMTLNTVEPAPLGEANRDGRVAFELGRIPAGDEYVFFLHFQVNPTNVGRRSQDVDLSTASSCSPRRPNDHDLPLTGPRPPRPRRLLLRSPPGARRRPAGALVARSPST